MFIKLLINHNKTYKNLHLVLRGMRINYKLDVSFDDNTAGVVESKTDYNFLTKYDAIGVGHEKTKTSTILFFLDKPLSKNILINDLENISLNSIEMIN